MDFCQAKQDIINWITGFVEQPHAQLHGWAPCPHARQARLDGKFDVKPGRIDPYVDLMHIDLDDKMVIAYVYDRQKYSAQEFVQSVKSVNKGFLVPRNIIALADHPDDKEEINGVCMNQGQHAIVFVQPLDKLNDFARLIAGKGYYDGWPEDYLRELFLFREDPRQ